MSQQQHAGATTLWRCRECGQWSHAKRRPTHHTRLIRGVAGGELPEGRTRADAAEQASDWELPIVELHPERSGTTYRTMAGEPHLVEPYEDWYEPPAVTVKCGPFEEYRAELVRPWHEDPRARGHARGLSIESMENGSVVARQQEPAQTARSTEGADVPF